jgi:hypothetical protein
VVDHRPQQQAEGDLGLALDHAAGGALGDAQKEKACGEAGGFTALTLSDGGGRIASER